MQIGLPAPSASVGEAHDDHEQAVEVSHCTWSDFADDLAAFPARHGNYLVCHDVGTACQPVRCTRFNWQPVYYGINGCARQKTDQYTVSF